MLRQAKLRTGMTEWSATCFTKIVAIVLTCVAMQSVRAQTPKIELAVSAEEVFIGETLDFQIEIQNVEKPNAPDISLLKDQFEVEFAGDQSRNQSSITSINGRISKKNVFRHIYLYHLKPKKAGLLTIPSITTNVDGKSISSSELSIRVQNVEDQDIVLGEIRVSQSEVFPTQTFSVTLRVYIKPVPENPSDPLKVVRKRPPHLQVDWLDAPDGLLADDKNAWLNGILSKNGVGFTLNEFTTQSGSLFESPREAVFDLTAGRERRNDALGIETEYFVYELTRKFLANKVGAYSFGSSMIKGTFVVGLEDSEYVGKRIVAIAPAATVLVKEVPTPRPESFVGGIGEYRVNASATPTKLRVGDPLTLTLEFERGKSSGSLDLLSAPNLTSNPDIVENFEIIDTNPTGRSDGDTKKFAYSLRPKRSGVSIPAIPLTTFDPVAQVFTDRSTRPISLTVEEAARVSNAEIVGTITPSNSNSLKQNASGIFQNITDPGLLRDERPNLQSRAYWIVAFWSAAGIGTVLVRMVQNRKSDTVRIRRQTATRNAVARLARAKKLTDPKEAIREVRSAIVCLIADTQNRMADGLTANDVEQAAERANVASSDRDAIRRIFSTLESAEYGAESSVETGPLITEAISWVEHVGPLLAKGTR